MLNDKDYKISVIIPARNIEKYLSDCLESVLCQTHENLEIIAVSDGSSDGTNEIIKSYAEKDGRIIPVFKESSGVSDTRSRGLEIASGDYIGFVDGDDLVEPDMYERLLRNALENNADISHCGYKMVFPNRTDYYYNTGKKLIQSRETGVKDIIEGAFVEPSLCNKLYKKSVVKPVKISADIKNNEDVLFNVFAFSNSEKSVYEDLPLYSYYRRDNLSGSSRLTRNKIFDPVTVAQEIFEHSGGFGKQVQSAAYQRLLNSVKAAYRTARVYKLKAYYKESDNERKRLKKIKYTYKLSKKRGLERLLFLYFPWLYTRAYKFYFFRVSKNRCRYEVE